MTEMTGAEMIVEALYREQVEVIFGYPGGAVLPIYDELYETDFRHVMPHHEQGGAHAADGYARSTGNPGVCIATSGPGGTNLVTGLATAYMDSVPVVAFTGQVPGSMIGTDAFQEADITGITVPITKHNYLVQGVEDIPRIVREAFHIAQTGRPGPVLVDIPKNLQQETGEFFYPDEVDLPGYKPNYWGHELQVEAAAEAINEAQQPVLYAGGGVISSGGSHELRELAKKADIPVTTTLTGLGAFDEQQELSLGMPGMHGTAEANLAISNTDLLIAVGARFDDRVTGKLEEFAPEAEIIHIDIDPAEVGKRVRPDIPIVGDVKNVLRQLNPLVEEDEHPDWKAQIAEWREMSQGERAEENKLLPHQIVETIYELTDGDAIITTEVGQHQMWAAQFYQYSQPRSFISSGGLGTMGYGFPAALGAQVGNEERTVFALAGDGSFQMNQQELATAAKNNLPVNIVLFNNQYLGMVRQWQEMFYDKRYSATCLREQANCPEDCSGPGDEQCPEVTPNFVKLAEAYGIKSKQITEVEEIKPALEEAIKTPEPYLLDFVIAEEENVFPMVPPGGTLDNMVLRGDADE